MREKSAWEGTLDTELSGLACIGRIAAVDTKARTCRVQTIGLPGSTDDLDLRDAKILHNAWHAQGDEDVFLPRVGSYCVILFAGSQPYILGYIPIAFEDGSAIPDADDNTEGLQSGDKTIATIAGNRLTLRSGGAVTLESTKYCRTYWIPSKNIINSVCENYELETNGGYFFWNTPEEETDLPDGTTRYDLFVWDNVLEPSVAVRLQLGSAEETQVPFRMDIGNLDEDLELEETPGVQAQATADGEVELRIKTKSFRQVGPATEDDEGFYAEQIDAENKQYSFVTPSGHTLVFNDAEDDSTITLIHSSGALLQIDNDGNVVLQSTSGHLVNLGEEDIVVTSKDGAVVTMNKDITIVDASGNQVLSITDSGVQITASKDITVSAPKIAIAGGAIDLGDSPSFHAVIYEKLEAIFDSHTHPTALGPSGPPMPPDLLSLTSSIPPKSAKADYVKIRGNLSP